MMVATGVVAVFGRQRIIGRVLLVLAFAAAGVIASPVSPAAARDDMTRADSTEICYQMSVHHPDASAMVSLQPPASGTGPDCTRVARSLLEEILDDSSRYAKVFAAGIARGQLAR